MILTAPTPASFLNPTVEPEVESAEQLALRCQAGCTNSFETLVDMFQVRIFNYLLQLLGNSHDAEDVAQETFVKAFRSIRRYDSRYRFSTWLFTIAKNTALSSRRGIRKTESIDALTDTLPIPDARSSVDAEWVWRAARSLKPRYFEALWLRYAEGFTIEEISGIMHLNHVSLKVILHRARNALAKRLQPDRPHLY